jgi:hypothetical protein
LLHAIPVADAQFSGEYFISHRAKWYSPNCTLGGAQKKRTARQGIPGWLFAILPGWL